MEQRQTRSSDLCGPSLAEQRPGQVAVGLEPTGISAASSIVKFSADHNKLQFSNADAVIRNERKKASPAGSTHVARRTFM